MAKITVTLQCLSESVNKAAIAMHKYTLRVPQLPQRGDFIKSHEHGYAEVARVVFDTEGNVTLVIK